MSGKMICVTTSLMWLASCVLPVDGHAEEGGFVEAQPEAMVQAIHQTCEPLPYPATGVIRVTPAQASTLPRIVAQAPAGSTILLEDGLYRFSGEGESERRLNFRRAGVTIRGASGDASKVILDGEYITKEMLYIEASEITVAHLTLTHAVDHLIHIAPPSGLNGTLRKHKIYDVRFVDGGEQFLKVNANSARTGWIDDGEVSCSSFVLTEAGRRQVEHRFTGCYTGGIDTHGTARWHVHNNLFQGIFCDNGKVAEHAIHLWKGARDSLVENNVIVDCARGIGLGLIVEGEARRFEDSPCPEAEGHVGHFGGVVRNNIVYATTPYYDTGIELDQVCGGEVYHNTVWSSPEAKAFASIDYRFPNTRVTIRNNIVNKISRRDGGQATIDHNIVAPDPAIFRSVDPATVDLRLSDQGQVAVDKGIPIEASGLDIDSQARPRGQGPDIGADER